MTLKNVQNWRCSSYNPALTLLDNLLGKIGNAIKLESFSSHL